ncbi:MAG: rod shape-determining protein MreD [Muribaculaceae bacterium]|nr:rod shape-determining protein MreD [Muribaculaceae bacterium]MCI9054432.1 rod shape-determining protein MreD [Muribaculaceae bacterium]
MNKTALSLLLLFVVLIPAQAVFFNNLVLFNVAVPLVFIYLIITLPVTYSPSLAMTIGFLTGVSIDALSDTPGVNALACTVLAFVRRPIFNLYMPSDDDLADQRPSLRTMGTPAFLKYALTMVVLYCAMVFSIEAMQVFNLRLYLLRVGCSSVFTFIIIYAIACLTRSNREKRL